MTSIDERSRNRWERAVDRQYNYWGTILGLLIAVIAILTNTLSDNARLLDLRGRFLLSVASVSVFAGIIVMMILVHLERKIAYFGGKRKHRDLENKLRLLLNVLILVDVVSLVALLLRLLWGL